MESESLHQTRKWSLSSNVDIKSGVRQGCLLSLCLFNLYTERIFKAGEDKRGININNLSYADDTLLMAENKKDLQEILYAINEKAKGYG